MTSEKQTNYPLSLLTFYKRKNNEDSNQAAFFLTKQSLQLGGMIGK